MYFVVFLHYINNLAELYLTNAQPYVVALRAIG